MMNVRLTILGCLYVILLVLAMILGNVRKNNIEMAEELNEMKADVLQLESFKERAKNLESDNRRLCWAIYYSRCDEVLPTGCKEFERAIMFEKPLKFDNFYTGKYVGNCE